MIDEDLVESAACETAFCMAGVYSPDYPMEHLGSAANDASNSLRALASYRLLGDGNVDNFYHNLIRSGMVRLHYLRRCLESGLLTDHFRGCSRYLPLCDALTAGHFALAKSIAAASPDEWIAGREYEDDYCYGRILNLLLLGHQDQAPPLVEQFARYTEGNSNGRLEMANALLSGRQPDFDIAFETLLKDREAEISRNIERGEIESPHVIAARRIFVEGLGILRLARSLGLHTEREYLFCPSIARIPMVRPFPGE